MRWFGASPSQGDSEGPSFIGCTAPSSATTTYTSPPTFVAHQVLTIPPAEVCEALSRGRKTAGLPRAVLTALHYSAVIPRYEKGASMTSLAEPPILPMLIQFDASTAEIMPAGPVLTRRMTDLEGLFANHDAWETEARDNDRVVYTVHSSPVPEIARELPQSITTILPGDVAGEFFMTKGHQRTRSHRARSTLA